LIANTVSPDALAFYLGQIAAGAAQAGRGLRDLDIQLRRPHACEGTGVDDVMRTFVQDVVPRLRCHPVAVDQTQAAMTR
jgi:hypothetical protein